MQRIAGEFDGDRSEREPAADDGIRFRRRLQGSTAFRSAPHPPIKLQPARAHACRVAEPALALDIGAYAFGGTAGQERAPAAQPPVVLRLVGLGRRRNLLEFPQRERAVILGHREFGGDQRAQDRQVLRRIGTDQAKRAPRLGDVARGDPLVGALQLVIVVIGRRSIGKFLVRARGIRVLVLVREAQRRRLIVCGRRRRRLHQAAGHRQTEDDGRDACHEPWTPTDRCHTLHTYKP